jgi:tripeptidyl-peptidase I
MLTLLNSQLVKAGKPTVGFVNPRLYSLAASNPAVFNDITEGDISCVRIDVGVCSQWSYSAQAGWDPASGLGSLNFDKLLSAFLS